LGSPRAQAAAFGRGWRQVIDATSIPVGPAITGVDVACPNSYSPSSRGSINVSPSVGLVRAGRGHAAG